MGLTPWQTPKNDIICYYETRSHSRASRDVSAMGSDSMADSGDEWRKVVSNDSRNEAS